VGENNHGTMRDSGDERHNDHEYNDRRIVGRTPRKMIVKVVLPADPVAFV